MLLAVGELMAGERCHLPRSGDYDRREDRWGFRWRRSHGGKESRRLRWWNEGTRRWLVKTDRGRGKEVSRARLLTAAWTMLCRVQLKVESNYTISGESLLGFQEPPRISPPWADPLYCYAVAARMPPSRPPLAARVMAIRCVYTRFLLHSSFAFLWSFLLTSFVGHWWSFLCYLLSNVVAFVLDGDFVHRRAQRS